MRDPLHWLGVRRKLALTFAGVCLLAFGVGGSLAATSASAALEEEIVLRLRYQCRAWAGSLDGNLRLLSRRAEDFASDGYIRERTAAAASLEGAAGAQAREDLRRHLATNKLPLITEWTELAVLDPGGSVVTTATGAPAPFADRLPSLLTAGTPPPWHSALLVSGDDSVPPAQWIAVPLRSLDGSREIGRLVAFVRTDRWIRGALGGLDAGGPRSGETFELTISDTAGQSVSVPAALVRGEPGADAALVVRPEAQTPRGTPDPRAPDISDRVTLAANGWTAAVRLHSPESLAPVSGLQTRFLLVGVALALTIGLLLAFPMRFLAQPLVELREAARRLQAGDLKVRVTPDTEDEIGDLGRSFNHMAEAVESRTRGLEAAAHEVTAQRDKLDTVIASLGDGIVVLDADGTPVLSNAAAKPLLGVLLDPTPGFVGRQPCDDARLPASNCGTCLTDLRRMPRACVLDAAGRTYEIRATPLPPGQDGRRGRVLVARDITDRIAQDEREIHQERLSVLGEVAAVMAHELNNPLAAISMFAQMAEDGLGPSSLFREHLEVIRRNTETCKRTIRELLDYAAGTAPQFGDLDLHDVLRDVARFLRPLAERTGAAVDLRLEASPSEMSGDEIQVRQVFVNLVMNALQAIGGTGGTVTLSTRNDGGHLTVDVTDTGPGVPDAARARIFEPFFTTKGRGAGTGLGLPTARRIAELHGGGVELVESAPGRTVFRVRLRARVAEAVKS